MTTGETIAVVFGGVAVLGGAFYLMNRKPTVIAATQRTSVSTAGQPKPDNTAAIVTGIATAVPSIITSLSDAFGGGDD